MRVGIDGRTLTDFAGRGIARYTRGLLAALARTYPEDEWRVLVCGACPEPPIPGINLVRVPLPGRALYGLAATVQRPRLDRVLGRVDVFWAPAPAPLSLSREVPFVLTLHDLSWELRPEDFTCYERGWHWITRPRKLALRATRVMAVSEPTRLRALERWRLDPRRVITVTQGLETPGKTPSAAAIAAVHDHYALPARYFLSVGALEPRKAPDVLARAFARARAAGLDADLVVVGTGRCSDLLVMPGVHLLGRVPEGELDSLYAGALALVMPSRLEGWGLPPLEAALRGTPSIVSDLPIFDATLGDSARRVPVDDAPALASMLIEFAGNPDLRHQMGARAAEAAQRFNPERSAHDVHAVLKEAIHGE